MPARGVRLSGGRQTRRRSGPPRDYLTAEEVERLVKAARQGRHGARDAAIVWIIFRHGLRASELVELEWGQLDLDTARIHVRRKKNGVSTVHRLDGRELRALRKVKRESNGSPWVFQSERRGPLTRRTLDYIVSRAGREAGLPFRVHAHMLRHSTGHHHASLNRNAREIQDFLGHRDYKMSVRYTQLNPNRFIDW